MLKLPQNPWEGQPVYRPVLSNQERHPPQASRDESVVEQTGGHMMGGATAQEVLLKQIQELNILWKNGNYYLNLGEMAGALVAFSNYAVYAHVVLMEHTPGGEGSAAAEATSSGLGARRQKTRKGGSRDWESISGITIEGATDTTSIQAGITETMQIALGYVETLQNKLNAITRGGEKDKEVSDVETCIRQSQDIIVEFKGKDCITFNDLVGLQKEKNAVLDSFVYPIIYKNLYGKLAKGMLLYGPPGTGKTLLAKASATQLQLENPNVRLVFLAPTGATLKGKYVGETEKNIMRAFRCASVIAKNCEENSRKEGIVKEYLAVMFIDEFDSIAGDRSTDTTGLVANSVNTLLQVMDGVISFPNVVLIAATNYPWNLDSAILRRFDQQLLLDYPTFEMVRDLCEKEIQKHYFRKYWEKEKETEKFGQKDPCAFGCENADSKEKFTDQRPPFDLFEYDYRLKNIDFQTLCDELYNSKYSNSDVAKVMQLAIRQASSKALKYPFIYGGTLLTNPNDPKYSNDVVKGLASKYISALTRLSDRKNLEPIVESLIDVTQDQLPNIYMDPKSYSKLGLLKAINYNGTKYYNTKLLLELPSDFLLVDDQISDFFMSKDDYNSLKKRKKNNVEVTLIFSKDMKVNNVKLPDKIYFRQILALLDQFTNDPSKFTLQGSLDSDSDSSGGLPSMTSSKGSSSSRSSGKAFVRPVAGTKVTGGVWFSGQQTDVVSCGRHAINNLLQGTFFDITSLIPDTNPVNEGQILRGPSATAPFNLFNLCQAVSTLVPRYSGELGCPRDSTHEFYTDVLLQLAMETAGWIRTGFHTGRRDGSNTLGSLNDTELVGKKVLVQLGQYQHYVSFYREDAGTYLYFESLGSSAGVYRFKSLDEVIAKLRSISSGFYLFIFEKRNGAAPSSVGEFQTFKTGSTAAASVRKSTEEQALIKAKAELTTLANTPGTPPETLASATTAFDKAWAAYTAAQQKEVVEQTQNEEKLAKLLTDLEAAQAELAAAQSASDTAEEAYKTAFAAAMTPKLGASASGTSRVSVVSPRDPKYKAAVNAAQAKVTALQQQIQGKPMSGGGKGKAVLERIEDLKNAKEALKLDTAELAEIQTLRGEIQTLEAKSPRSAEEDATLTAKKQRLDILEKKQSELKLSPKEEEELEALTQDTFFKQLHTAYGQNEKVDTGTADEKKIFTGKNILFLKENIGPAAKNAIEDFETFFKNYVGLNDFDLSLLTPAQTDEINKLRKSSGQELPMTAKVPMYPGITKYLTTTIQEKQDGYKKQRKQVNDIYIQEVFQVLKEEDVEYTRFLIAAQFIVYAVRRVRDAKVIKSETVSYTEEFRKASEDIQYILKFVHYLLLPNSRFSRNSNWPPGTFNETRLKDNKLVQTDAEIRVYNLLELYTKLQLFEDIHELLRLSEEFRNLYGNVSELKEYIINYDIAYEAAKESFYNLLRDPKNKALEADYTSKLQAVQTIYDNLKSVEKDFDVVQRAALDGEGGVPYFFYDLQRKSAPGQQTVQPQIDQGPGALSRLWSALTGSSTASSNDKKLKGGALTRKHKSSARNKTLKGGSKGAKSLYVPAQYMVMAEKYIGQADDEQEEMKRRIYDFVTLGKIKLPNEGAKGSEDISTDNILTIAENIIVSMEQKSYHTQFFFVAKYQTNSERWRPAYYLNSSIIKPLLTNMEVDFGKIKGNKSSLFKFLMTRTVAFGYLNYGSNPEPIQPTEDILWYDFKPTSMDYVRPGAAIIARIWAILTLLGGDTIIEYLRSILPSIGNIPGAEVTLNLITGAIAIIPKLPTGWQSQVTPPDWFAGIFTNLFGLLTSVGSVVLSLWNYIYLAGNLLGTPGYNYWLETSDKNYTILHAGLLMTFDGKGELYGDFFSEETMRSNFGEEFMKILSKSTTAQFVKTEAEFVEPGAVSQVYEYLMVLPRGIGKGLKNYGFAFCKFLFSLLFNVVVPYQEYYVSNKPTVPQKFVMRDGKFSENNFVMIPKEIITELMKKELEQHAKSPQEKGETNSALTERLKREQQMNLINLNLPLSCITEAIALFPSNYDKKIYDDLIAYNTNRNKFLEAYRARKK